MTFFKLSKNWIYVFWVLFNFKNGNLYFFSFFNFVKKINLVFFELFENCKKSHPCFLTFLSMQKLNPCFLSIFNFHACKKLEVWFCEILTQILLKFMNFELLWTLEFLEKWCFLDHYCGLVNTKYKNISSWYQYMNILRIGNFSLHIFSYQFMQRQFYVDHILYVFHFCLFLFYFILPSFSYFFFNFFKCFFFFSYHFCFCFCFDVFLYLISSFFISKIKI